MKRTISLIRHGITEGNKNRWYYGASDLPLLNEGIDNIVELSKEDIYPNPNEKTLITSGMTRTEQTFFLIYGNMQHEIFSQMREMEFGIFEKQSYEELKEIPKYIEWITDESHTMVIPGGESIKGFVNRIISGFETLKNRDEDIILVCHGGVISAIMRQYFANSDEYIFKWIPNPGRGFSLTIEDGKVSSYEEI